MEARTAGVFLPLADSAGGGLKLHRLPLDALYTPPRTRSPRPRATLGSGFVPLPSLLEERSRIVVEGGAGCGKTAFLHRIALALARDGLGRRPPGGSWRESPHRTPPPLPVLLDAHEVSARIPDTSARGTLSLPGVEPGAWEAPLSRGGVTFLIDSAEEAEGAERKRLLATLAALAARWPGCPVVLASRPPGIRDFQDTGFFRAAIEPFDPDEARRFAVRWCCAAGRPVSPDGADRSPSAPRDPLLLALHCALGEASPRPPTPASICRAVADRLEPTGEQPDEARRPVDRLLAENAVAEELAEQLHRERESAPAWQWIRERLADPRVSRVLELLPSALVEAGGPGPLFHRLAALALDRRADPGLRARAAAGSARALVLAAQAGWHAPPEVLAHWAEVAAALSGILERPGVTAADRIAAAEAAGVLLDPGTLDSLAALLPVQGRPGVRLARDPVTVAEFAGFVAAHGYDDPSLWSGEGWAMRSSEAWTAPGDWEVQLRTPSRPVVNVSFHESVAFSRWAAARAGTAMALPPAAVWAAAAAHADGPYPWGAAEPEPERLNFDQYVGCATPVGAYPAGAAPGGHRDLGGNVWEWCSDADAEGFRAVRGGGWYSKAPYVRSDYVYYFHPGNRYHDLGFRIAEMAPGRGGLA